MDKFDQWYNKKMDEQKVAYSGSSWDSFSSQLGQLPAKHNRRRPLMYLWIFALSIGFGGGTIFAWQASKSSSNENAVPVLNKDQESLNANPSTNDKTDESKNVDESIQPIASQIVPESPLESNKPGTNPSIIAPENEYGANTLSSSETSLKRRSITKRSLTSVNNTSELNTETGMFKTNSGKSVNKTSIPNSQINSAGVNSYANTSVDDTYSRKEKLSEAPLSSNNELFKYSEEEANTVFSFDNMSVNQVIEPLILKIKSLDTRSESLPQSALAMNNLQNLGPRIVACCSFKGWNHQVELGAQFFPGVKEGSRFYTGIQAAYHLQYRWAKRWSASAGAGVMQRWGSFGGFQDSPQDIYTSTRVRRGFLLVPTSATYMQFPTMVNYHAGKHIIGAGVRTLLLLGVQGQLDEYSLERNGNEVDFSLNSSTVNTGWINESGFRSIVPEYMLTYSYQFNQHLSISVSGAWMPNGIVYAEKNSENLDILSSLTFDSGSSQQPFLLEDKWQAGISLRYKF